LLYRTSFTPGTTSTKRNEHCRNPTKCKEINETGRYPAAHNGLVAGSSPGRPTSLRSRSGQGCRAGAHRAKTGYSAREQRLGKPRTRPSERSERLIRSCSGSPNQKRWLCCSLPPQRPGNQRLAFDLTIVSPSQSQNRRPWRMKRPAAACRLLHLTANGRGRFGRVRFAPEAVVTDLNRCSAALRRTERRLVEMMA
jgi:hypothetical protein